MSKSIKYEIHPAANLFPLMSEDEYQGLKADIKEWGQREDIIAWRGKIIDGRNRLRACQELGIEPSIADLDDHHDPIAYVISHNLHRRHLTTSQRAMVAANIANLKHGGDRKDSKVSIDTLKIDDAAKQLNVSPESVKRAKLVKDKGTTELADMVRDGKVSVDAASKVAKKPKAEQAAIVATGPQAVKEAAKTPVPKRVSKGSGVPKGVQRYAEWRMSFCQKHDARTAAGKKVYDDWVAVRRLEFKGLFEFLGRCELFWDHADDTAKDAIHEWLDQHEPDLRHAAMANEGTPLLENGTGGTP